MNLEKATEAIENILYSDLNLSEGTKKGLQYFINLAEKLEEGKIEQVIRSVAVNNCKAMTELLLPSPEKTQQQSLSQKILSYLTEGK